ncbi:MAG: transglycosylase SLT domain-containing protein [Proteobacteria bacterium]|nr:transglycosylase SLT domain-containing protein [Pseudomonadota bacterium]
MGGRITVAIAAGLAALGLVPSCATPPENPEDLCAIFEEKRAWYRDAVSSQERWGVPEPLQLALIHQESSFRARARPPRRRFLWILPGSRPSSAYGYGQVVDSTWTAYRRHSGRRGADRSDFGDVTDFIGWYADYLQRRAGVSKIDAYGLYLAYHEGPRGFSRGTHNQKRWLLNAAHRVESRTRRYTQQYAGCKERLDRPWWRRLF